MLLEESILTLLSEVVNMSDISIFSFHPVKIITTGEGGAALTNNEELARKMRLSTHGLTREIDQMIHETSGAWYYEQIDLGYNYRMTDIQAALGLSQLEKLDIFVKKRHEIADIYNSKLKGLPIKLPLQSLIIIRVFICISLD